MDNSGDLSTSDDDVKASTANDLGVYDEVDYWISDSDYYSTSWSGSGTSSSPYLISSAADLALLSYNVFSSTSNRYSGKYFKQTCDIDLTGHYWMPIGGHCSTGYSSSYYFLGSYDGGGYTILGVTTYYDADADDLTIYQVVGVFGYVRGSTTSVVIGNIHDVHTDSSCSFYGYSDVASIVGLSSGAQIYNCSNEGVVNGVLNVGGILATGRVDFIYNCYNKGSVSGTTYIGGIYGCINSSAVIRNCFNLGAVSSSAKNSYVGGIATNNTSVASIYILNCFDLGAVSCTSTTTYLGAIFGGGASSVTCFVCYYGGDCSSSVGGINGTDYTSSSCYAAYSSSLSSDVKEEDFYSSSGVWSDYAKWDFSSVWTISSGVNDGYPSFQSDTSSSSYTLTYNSNITSINSSNTNSTSTQTVQTSSLFITKSSSAFSYSGYTIIGWSMTQVTAVFNAAYALSYGCDLSEDDAGVAEQHSSGWTFYYCWDVSTKYIYAMESGVTLYAIWGLASYTLTYNSNLTSISSSNTNSTSSQTVTYLSSFTTKSSSAFSCDGYEIVGWSTTQQTSVVSSFTGESSGTSYTGTDGTFWSCGTSYVYSMTSTDTLYAVWKEVVTYTITYNSNFTSISSSATNTTSTQSVVYSASFTTLTSSAFSYTGTGYTYTLLGWSTTQKTSVATSFTGKSSGTSYTGSTGTYWSCNTSYVYDYASDDVLYAVWKRTANTYSLTFNSNLTAIDSTYSNTTSSKTVTYASSFTTLASTTFDSTKPTGYAIVGWSTTQTTEVVSSFTGKSSGSSYTGISGTYWSCDTSYVYNLAAGDILYAVWAKDIGYDSDEGFWYVEDGYMPQSVCSTPSDVYETGESYTISVSDSVSANVVIFVDDDDEEYAYVTIGSKSAWFVVEPIVWIVAYGEDEPTSVTSAVTAKVVICGYGASSAGIGWSWASSNLFADLTDVEGATSFSYAGSTEFSYDNFSSYSSTALLGTTTASSQLSIASVSEIDALGGSYASTCTDFVAFLLSGGSSTDGDSYSADYWTRDLEATLDDSSTYYSNTNTAFTYSGALNNGVYVTKDGTLSNAKLKNCFGARLTMNV